MSVIEELKWVYPATEKLTLKEFQQQLSTKQAINNLERALQKLKLEGEG